MENEGGRPRTERQADDTSTVLGICERKTVAITIDQTVLENACKNIIDLIMFCLPNAFKGTVYRIGGPPDIIAERITSGLMNDSSRKISWGLPDRSDYNPPGKPWTEYRDQPGRPLEAMAWCVEKQKSWTAEDPKHDLRSVRLQVEGVWEDYHHMEPVLIRKTDLAWGEELFTPYPKNHKGEIIWQGSDTVVVAVIKIHFKPYTIKIGSPETKIIKRLSSALGTELLSYQLRQKSLEAMRHLAQDKLTSCNILADSLRNAITKSGLIFSLIKLELGFLRDQWEFALLEHSDKKGMKEKTIRELNDILFEWGESDHGIGKELVGVQNRFLEFSLPPVRGENWVHMQIEERWKSLLMSRPMEASKKEMVLSKLDQLKKSLYLGKDPEILAAFHKIPEGIKEQWTELIYGNTDRLDLQFLQKIIRILEDPSLKIPHQEKSKKSLIHLTTLAKIMGQLEDNTNEVLRKVLNGSGNSILYSVTP
jgi:hypothetical protein